jgi:hypothetical protein
MQKNPQKQIFHFPKKIIPVFFIALLTLFSFSSPKKAQAWDAQAAAIYKQTQENINYATRGMMMGALKQAAIGILTKQMDRFISGVSRNGARFINNWEDYLINNPTRNAQRYANDYISHAISGRGSVSYKKRRNAVFGASTIAGEGFNQEMVLGEEDEQLTSEETYAQTIQNMANARLNAQEFKPYKEEPKEMFENQDNLSGMNTFLNGNTIFDFDSKVTAVYEKKLLEEKQIAAAEAQANGGYKSKKAPDGTVLKPGKDFQQMQANTDNLPNLAVIGATSLGELIAATVSRAISGAVSRTISGVERTIDKEINNVTKKAVREVNKKVNSYGPGALYKK